MSKKIVDRSRWSRTLIETNFQQKKLNNCFDRIRAMMEYKVKLLFFFFFTLSLFPNLVLLFLSTMYFFSFYFFSPMYVHSYIRGSRQILKKKKKNGAYLERTIFFNRLLHFFLFRCVYRACMHYSFLLSFSSLSLSFLFFVFVFFFYF